jgi:hypothetical protein
MWLVEKDALGGSMDGVPAGVRRYKRYAIRGKPYTTTAGVGTERVGSRSVDIEVI